MKNTKGVVLILIASLLFASYGVWAKLIGDDMGVFFQGWSRGLIIALALFPILYFKKLIIPIERKDWKWLAVFLVFTAFTQAPLFYAFTHMDIGSATLLFFVSMLLTMYLVGFLFLGEKMSRVKVISFILAGAGMYMIFSFSLVAFTLLAALMAIVNGIASGGEIPFSKKISGSYSVLYITWLSWIIIAITNAPISIFLGEPQLLPSLDIVWLWQLGYTVASMLAFWLIIEGLKSVEAGVGGLLGLLEIVFSIALGVILFKEGVTIQIAIGAVLILLAAALPHIKEMYNKRNESDLYNM
ncbi:MAG: DMT family transporter [Candidatus Pacebacteria bacterium]|nr:DMT family transporter [Candidatus Paceibacterota bacterium]